MCVQCVCAVCVACRHAWVCTVFSEVCTYLILRRELCRHWGPRGRLRGRDICPWRSNCESDSEKAIRVVASQVRYMPILHSALACVKVVYIHTYLAILHCPCSKQVYCIVSTFLGTSDDLYCIVWWAPGSERLYPLLCLLMQVPGQEWTGPSV